MSIHRLVRLLLVIVAGAIYLASPLAAQYSEDVFNLKKASDLYDERGFEQGKVVSVDGKLAVTASNGNVSYSYPISDYQVNGHPVKVSLNYCGSVSFTCFKDYKVADRITSAPFRGWSRFHQNRPAWIIGACGWAIDVLACTGGSFHCDSNSNVFKQQTPVYDKDMIFVADGYDFGNKMKDFGAPASHPSGENFVDEINILREDGSILNLVHVRPDSTLHPDNREDLYTGYYVENSANAHGYAIVEFDPSWQSPAVTRIMHQRHVVDSLGIRIDTVGGLFIPRDTIYKVYRCFSDGCRDLPFIPRVVHYYDGSGTEAIFHEYQTPYGMGAYRDYDAMSGGFYGGPTIFYLEQIRTNTGPLLTFTRPRHYPYIWRGYDGNSETDESWTWDDSTRGRALITEFDNHRISFGYNSLTIEALGRTTTVRFDQVTRNGNATAADMMPIANLGMLTPASLATATWKERNAQLYTSFVGYVTEITDPMGRKTTFDYEPYTRTYRNFGFPYTASGTDVDVVLKNLRLSKVHEPTANYEIAYYGTSSEMVKRGVDPYPYQTTNVAATVKKKDRSGTLLTTEGYDFDWNGPQNQLRWVTETATDNIRSASTATKTYYGYTELSNLDPSLLAPHHTEVTRIEVTTPEVSTVTINSYTDQHMLPSGSTITAPYVILPEATTTSVNGITKSHQSFSYVIDTLRKFLPDPGTIVLHGETVSKVTGLLPGSNDMASRFGMEVVKRIVRTHDPSNFSTLLRIDTTTYTHIGLTDTVITWASMQWNKFASIQEYLHRYEDLHDSLTQLYTWEQLMYWPPVGQYTYDTLTDEVLSPPVYGLESRVSTVDGSGAYLIGKISSYRTTLTEGYGRQFLGSLLADSAIGRGGIKKLGLNSYTYADALHNITTGNLLSRITNANGSTIAMMYDPSFCYPSDYGPWDTCFEARTLKTLNNDGSVTERLQAPSGNAALYGKPMIQTKRIRTFDASGHIAYRDLHTCNEYGFYGRPTATADPNGWLSAFEYDRNARLTTAWLPGDFSRDSAVTESDTLDYTTSLDEQLFGKTSYDRQIDTVVCTVSGSKLHKHIGIGPHVTSTNEDTLFAMLPTTAIDTPRCRCEDVLPLARMQKSGGDGGALADIDHHQGWPQQDTCNSSQIFDNVAGYDGFVGHLEYYKGAKSGLGMALSLDSVMLETTITSILGQCVHLEVSIPELSFTRTFVLNCPGPVVAMATHKEDMGLQSLSPSPYGYRLLIDLTGKISQLMALSTGSTLHVDFKVTTSGAAVMLASGIYAEDARPHLLLQGKFRQIAKRTDYTLAYDNDDQNLTTTSHAKIDDIHHTSNIYDPTHFPGENIRRNSAVSTFGADYRVLETDLHTVLRDGTTRIDATVNSLSGDGHVLSTTDAAGDAGATQYDALGRPTRMTNADGTHSTIAYYYGTPISFGITGQDFYGFCMATVMTSESGIKMVKYTDALDRLRREVADSGASGHLNLTTRYEYDILGRLLSSTDPKGTVTHYWYDEFGRTKYKQQPDLGIVSYAYDNVGNVRFTQDQEQAGALRMTFNEYDDANRITITGEAQFAPAYRTKRKLDGQSALQGVDTSFARLTDDLDASGLQDGGVSLIPTANATLWRNATVNIPKFWTLDQADSVTCTVGPDTLLSESVNPVGWFLRHPAQQWTPQMPTAPADSFENIASYPQFVRMAVSYDTLPPMIGPVWQKFPDHAAWNKLAPTGKVRNLLGREAVVAYREHGGEPFHYAVLSYDERGRVEALLRYTENLGFDAVYYTYNSMEQVTSVRVVDPIRQYTTWYGHDHNGRTDSIWTLLGNGFGLQYPQYLTPPSRPGMADVVYAYTVTGQVDTMRYDPVNVLVKYAYNHRKWLDSMVATKGGAPLFKQVLTFDPTGQVMSQRWQHGTSPAVVQGYGYDSIQRLVRWENGSDTVRWAYDQVGSRISELNKVPLGGARTRTYLYGGPVTGGVNRPGQMIEQDTTGMILGQESYGYDANGAVTGVRKWGAGGVLTSQDSLIYSDRGLLREYTHLVPGSSTQEWHYRYSAGAEREQKRLYFQQDGSHNVIPHNSWVYYLLGGNKEQLAVYHGQEMDLSGCVPPKPGSVYLYPVEYLTYGNGSSVGLVTKPDVGNPAGVKEFHIDDHLGSTRVIISAMMGVQGYDYDPWGILMAAVTPPREGYIGKELDKESRTLNCGVRQSYNWWFGSVDLLWEKCRAWSPYTYSQASPLRYSDPNGLEVDVSGMMVYNTHKNGQKKTDVWSSTLVWELQRLTGLTLYIENGLLKADLSQKATSGSPTARKKLLEMINSPDKLELVVNEDLNGSGVYPKSDCNRIYFNPTQMTNMANGAVGVSRLTMSWGMTLFHEYAHTPMGGHFNDPPDDQKWGHTDVPDLAPNDIRAELGGMGRRESYRAKEINGVRYLPMTKEAFNQLNVGKIPETGYVFYVPLKGDPDLTDAQ